MRIIYCLVLGVLLLSCNTVSKKEYQDPETLWGELYTDVNAAGFFKNPKEFWDASPKGNAKSLLKFYLSEKKKEGFELESFVRDNFEIPGYLIPYKTSDDDFETYVKKEFLNLLTKPRDDGGSLIPTRMRYISGGGMFNEYNYFRSFFGVKAFQALNNDSLANNTAANCYQFIQDYGYIPYGNRSYYLGFSDFPAASLIAESVSDRQPHMLPWFGNLLARDYQNWMGMGEADKEGFQEALKSRGGPFKTVVFLEADKTLNRYFSGSKDNSYLSLLKTTEWEGSSRFMEGGIQKPEDFIPVDLNAAMFHTEQVLAQSFASKNRNEYNESYNNLSKTRKELVDKYLYNPESGFYYDYNFKTKTSSEAETLAAVFPVLTGLSTSDQSLKVIKKIERDFLTRNGLLNDRSQDYGSAEMNYIAILALRKAGRADLAETVKKRWIALNRNYFEKNKHVLPVYNLKSPETSAKTPARIDGALAVLTILLNE